MEKHINATALVFFAGLATTACSIDVRGEEAVVREEKRFTVSGPVDLTLQTFDGAIEVRSWDRSEVLVEIDRRAADAESARDLEVRATQDAGRIVVEARNPREWGRELIHVGSRRSPAVSLIVTAPRQVTLHARTGDGPIWARDLTGTIALETGDGRIHAERLEGDVRAHTGDGGIEIDQAKGRVDLHSGDGSIQINGQLEELRVHSGDGSVRVDAARGSEMKSDWAITTGDGRVTLGLPAGFNAEVDAHSGDGAVSLDGLRETRAEAEEGGSQRRRIGRGGRTLRVQTGDGAIEINTR
jgi:DUF4097 and DUF4098 domain-containing protein YvlB